MGVLCRGSGLPLDTRNTIGTSGNFCESLLYLLEKDYLSFLRESKEFGIIFLQIETSEHQKYHETLRRSETRAAGFCNTNSSICLESYDWESLKSHSRNLFSKLHDGNSEIFHLGVASRKFPDSEDFSVGRSIPRPTYALIQYVLLSK